MIQLKCTLNLYYNNGVNICELLAIVGSPDHNRTSKGRFGTSGKHIRML